MSPKKFVAASSLIVEQVVPPGAQQNESLLEAQAEVVGSSEVLRLADKDRELGSLPSLAKFNDPVPAVKRALHVEAAPRRNLLTITYTSESRDDAVKVVNLIVDAYRRYQSDERGRRAEALASAVRTGRAKIEDELLAAERSLAEFDAARGGAMAAEASTQRAATLGEALAHAELDTFNAKRDYDDAVADAGPALAGMDEKQLEETLHGPTDAILGDSGEAAAQEIKALARQLVELRRTYAQNHPAVIRATQRLKQMRLAQVGSTRQRWQSAQTREATLRETVDKIQRDNVGQAARMAERTRLVTEVERARARADALDRQLNDILLSTAAGALTVRIDSPAEVNAADHPPLPRPAPTLATAAAIGLAFGGLFALVGEFRDAGSLRHVVPLRTTRQSTSEAVGAALKLRVLATVPAADREDSDDPRDLARAAQLDPFGPIANGVRAMRLAMTADGKLPGTILLTAAADRQSTTTIAINLAMTLARENLRVLLVDMNWISPMVAALVGVEGKRGLSELIAGGEPVDLIRPTEVPRLDVLGAGSPPADSAALLNTDRFAEVLTMLATAYDHVVIDAPPLSRGDDARIAASLCAGTVLISRATSASLRRAAGARDLLLMIGANLLGVAISRGDAPVDPIVPAGGVPGPMGGIS